MNDNLHERLSEAQDLRERRRKRLDRKENDEDKIREDLDEVNKRLAGNRKKREKLRDEGREAKADDVADRIEDLEDLKDDLLIDLDDKKERTEKSEKLLKEAQDRVRGIRKKIEARRKSREGNGDLTDHFSLDEFRCRDGTPVPSSAVPALKRLCETQLEPLRAKFGRPVRITSGYRTRSYNASIGGASMSFHIYDERPGAPAVDHWVEGVSNATVQNYYDNKDNPPDGMGYYGGFTHIDERGYRSRWYGAG